MSTKTDLMKDRLVKLMKRRWITPLDALQLAGCLSLSQRCGELRRAGMAVEDKWVELDSGKRVKAYRVSSRPTASPLRFAQLQA